MTKIKTAFYRAGVHGDIKRIVTDDGYTNKELVDELRGNGFSVLKIYSGDISYKEFDEWYFLNRKK